MGKVCDNEAEFIIGILGNIHPLAMLSECKDNIAITHDHDQSYVVLDVV